MACAVLLGRVRHPGGVELKAIHPDAFDTLLAAIDSDRDRAGEKYEEIRLGLVRYFEWRGCTCPEELTDDTIDRVSRRLHEGQVIHAVNPLSYFYGVARNILRESWKAREKDLTPASPSSDPLVEPAADHDEGAQAEREQRLECLSRCLDRLPVAHRELIIEYYQLEKGEQIAHRTRLAKANGLPINALRLRVHRIRAKLERCVEDCLSRLNAGATSIRDSATRF